MAGTDTLTALCTGCLVSGQPCHTRADRRNVFDCLFYLGLISKVSATAVRTNTESHFNILVDVIGLMAKSTGMSMLCAWLWLPIAERAKHFGRLNAPVPA